MRCDQKTETWLYWHSLSTTSTDESPVYTQTNTTSHPSLHQCFQLRDSQWIYVAARRGCGEAVTSQGSNLMARSLHQNAFRQNVNPKAAFPLPVRSTRPSRSPKFPDQARPIKFYATCSRPSPLVYGRVTIGLIELIGYWSAKKTLITSRSLLERLASRSIL